MQFHIHVLLSTKKKKKSLSIHLWKWNVIIKINPCTFCESGLIKYLKSLCLQVAGWQCFCHASGHGITRTWTGSGLFLCLPRNEVLRSADRAPQFVLWHLLFRHLETLIYQNKVLQGIFLVINIRFWCLAVYIVLRTRQLKGTDFSFLFKFS